MRILNRKLSKTAYCIAAFSLVHSLSACAAGETKTASADSNPALFTEVTDLIPFENRNRRKFDNAIIADLDQDGLQDIVINEHGREMRIFWNEGGTFSQGPQIASGDVHGGAIGDYDKNGKIDVVITQGGGGGNNPRQPLRVEVSKDRSVSEGVPYNYFEKGRGRAAKFLNRPADSALNLLITGFATPNQSKGANHYYNNVGDGSFKFDAHLPFAERLGFRAAVTDFNSDNIDDVLLYGAGIVLAAQGDKDGKFEDVTEQVFGDLAKMVDVSSVTEIDFDNDGDFDLFFTRSEFQFDLETYYNPKDKRFAFLSFRRDFQFEDLLVEGDLIVENLQRTFPHRAVYLGAAKTPYEFPGDPHGHHDMLIEPTQAQGWPEGDLKGGLYIGYVGDGYWRVGGHTQSRIAGTFRNVVAPPETTPQPDLPARLFENRSGKFVDVTAAMGIDIPDQTTSATSADFNNDGFLDLAILRYGSMADRNEHLVYLNLGGKSFESANGHGLKAEEIGATGGAVEIIDFDSDGKVDLVYSNERGKWHLMKNTLATNSVNKFVIVKVGNSPAGGTPLGSILKLDACGQSFYRKVGSTSAGYSQSLNTELHVGIGRCDAVERATVSWADGRSVTFDDLQVNSTVRTP